MKLYSVGSIPRPWELGSTPSSNLLHRILFLEFLFFLRRVNSTSERTKESHLLAPTQRPTGVENFRDLDFFNTRINDFYQISISSCFQLWNSDVLITIHSAYQVIKVDQLVVHITYHIKSPLGKNKSFFMYAYWHSKLSSKGRPKT